mmetsp:Transcript_26957/g.86492  ORF Transcript_26957/g.86492 Transcript_26957/m.86492 type:complete len:204 (+) Transcript_26957:934-1545(+)
MHRLDRHWEERAAAAHPLLLHRPPAGRPVRTPPRIGLRPRRGRHLRRFCSHPARPVRPVGGAAPHRGCRRPAPLLPAGRPVGPPPAPSAVRVRGAARRRVARRRPLPRATQAERAPRQVPMGQDDRCDATGLGLLERRRDAARLVAAGRPPEARAHRQRRPARRHRDRAARLDHERRGGRRPAPAPVLPLLAALLLVSGFAAR